MGTAPMICGCKIKTSNVVQPSPIKTVSQSGPTYEGSDSRPNTADKQSKVDLIVSEVDRLSSHSFADVNNNNNAHFEQTELESAKTMANSGDHKVLKKYDLQAVIGEGSFSKVLKVQSKQTKEFYALKIVDKAKSLESDTPTYERELKILSRVRHPSIITLYEVFHSNAKVYLVLELATGGDLFDRISSKGNYSETLARNTLYMITSGVSYLHQLGISHRDLKLENMLYKHPGEDSQILISDFGLGHITEDRVDVPVGMWTTCGSAEYLAPEVLDGEMYSSMIDIWALGVIAYVVLSGYMPFIDQNRARLYQKIKSGVISFTEQPWETVSSLAKEFVCKLLEVNPEKRLSAEQALNHPWILEPLT